MYGAAVTLVLLVVVKFDVASGFTSRRSKEWWSPASIAQTPTPESPTSSSARNVGASIFDNTGGAEESDNTKRYSFEDLIVDMDFDKADRADEETERWIVRRRELLRDRFTAAGTYRIQLPLVQQVSSVNYKTKLFGMTVVEVTPGLRISERELDLDTMRITIANDPEEMQVPASLDLDFRGLLVKSVVPDSPAERVGVQAGDVLAAVSATIGGAVWPKSTLQGVQSALSSRRLTSGTVTLELRRLESEAKKAEVVDADVEAGVLANSANPQYELTLTRPLSFQIGESGDGYVVVTGVSESACTLVQYAVAVGDRVVAVDSSLGDTLWPVSTVEGVISAVTGRLPGQGVTLRFERPKSNIKAGAISPLAKSIIVSDSATRNEKGTETVTSKPPSQQELIKRCREVLKRYSGKDVATRNTAFQQMSALVADKVVDALASVSSTIDSVTLSMIMNAYLSSNEVKSAIRIFEAATGFSGDGSSNLAKEVLSGKGGGQIVPSESALNLFTGTALMQAHAKIGDYNSVLRVLAALEGRSGVVDDDGVLESAPWPWTGVYGSIQPDTVCYNVAIAAAEKLGGSAALLKALDLFDRMSDSKIKKSGPVKNEVTYNTLISALCNAGQTEQAFGLFEQMRRAGLRPDKFTYTSLIKVCLKEGDIQELLYDMRECGVQPDVVTYNTVIKSLCDKRQLTQATRVVTGMEARGIAPDSRTYGSLMNGLLHAGKPSSCLTLFESACSNSRTASLTENVHLYTTAITAASVLGDHERALDLVSRMSANGVKPNLKTLTSVMGACLASGEPTLAAQLYRKIEKPDGYAMRQGIRALCASGDLSSAAGMIESQRRGMRLLSGQQMMMSYKNILQASLAQKDYSMARRMFSDLLEKGYIPNKSILFSIIDVLDLNRLAGPQVADVDEDTFRYLLFMIDSLSRRNLPVESILYAATIALGGRLGGHSRMLASLLAQVKSTMNAVKEEILSSSQDAKVGESKISNGWEELYDKVESLPQGALSSEQLPLLLIRVAPRDVVRILRAEQSVTFSNRRKSPLKSRTESNSRR